MSGLVCPPLRKEAGMTLSIYDFLVVDFDDGYDGMRAATFGDLASLEGAGVSDARDTMDVRIVNNGFWVPVPGPGTYIVIPVKEEQTSRPLPLPDFEHEVAMGREKRTST